MGAGIQSSACGGTALGPRFLVSGSPKASFLIDCTKSRGGLTPDIEHRMATLTCLGSGCAGLRGVPAKLMAGPPRPLEVLPAAACQRAEPPKPGGGGAVNTVSNALSA